MKWLTTKFGCMYFSSIHRLKRKLAWFPTTINPNLRIWLEFYWAEQEYVDDLYFGAGWVTIKKFTN